MVREHHVSAADFIYPLFVHEGATNEPIGAMPGAQRWSLDGLLGEVGRAWDLGIRCVVLFPKVADGLKTEDGSECFNEGGLIPRAIRRIKQEHPGMTVMTDVALDPYSCDGHDGIVSNDGIVLNDETVEILCKQAVTQAAAGADQHVSCTPVEVAGPVVCRVQLRARQKHRRGRVAALGSPLRRAQNLLPGRTNHVPARGEEGQATRAYHGRYGSQRPSWRRWGELPGSCWPPAPT